MRVDYTLPSLQPWEPTEAPETSAEERSSFRDLVRGDADALPMSVEQQLRLDLRPFTGSYVGPPPRPRNLDLCGIEEDRRLWRNILRRHGAVLSEMGGASTPEGRAVQAMLRMLLEMQDMEDSLVAQGVALTRG